jgi:hypothetical protein
MHAHTLLDTPPTTKHTHTHTHARTHARTHTHTHTHARTHTHLADDVERVGDGCGGEGGGGRQAGAREQRRRAELKARALLCACRWLCVGVGVLCGMMVSGRATRRARTHARTHAHTHPRHPDVRTRLWQEQGLGRVVQAEVQRLVRRHAQHRHAKALVAAESAARAHGLQPRRHHACAARGSVRAGCAGPARGASRWRADGRRGASAPQPRHGCPRPCPPRPCPPKTTHTHTHTHTHAPLDRARPTTRTLPVLSVSAPRAQVGRQPHGGKLKRVHERQRESARRRAGRRVCRQRRQRRRRRVPRPRQPLSERVLCVVVRGRAQRGVARVRATQLAGVPQAGAPRHTHTAGGNTPLHCNARTHTPTRTPLPHTPTPHTHPHTARHTPRAHAHLECKGHGYAGHVTQQVGRVAAPQATHALLAHQARKAVHKAVAGDLACARSEGVVCVAECVGGGAAVCDSTCAFGCGGVSPRGWHPHTRGAHAPTRLRLSLGSRPAFAAGPSRGALGRSARCSTPT